MARVSIVIAARNEAAHIAACIGALQNQTVPVDIIVADGESTDDTAAIARNLGVRVMNNPDRTAPAGWNRGIRASTTEYVGVMNAHAAPQPDYVQRCLEAFERTGAWAVGGRIIRAAHSPMQAAIAAATSSPIGVGDAVHNYSTTERAVESVFPGMWPRWVFDRVGYLDASQLRSEDAEFSYRIRKAGGLVWYDPAIGVHYHPRDTLRALFRQYHDYGCWKVRLHRLHPGALRPRQLVPSVWLAAIILGLLLPAMRVLLIPAVGIYGLIAGAAAVWYRRPLVIAALVTMHAAYGIGMWRGAFRFLVVERDRK